MLYQIYETNRAWLSPFSEFASAASKLYSHPMSPMAQMPQAQRVAAGFDLIHRLTKEYEKPSFDIHEVKVDGVEIVIQEQVVEEKPFCRLIRFKRFKKGRDTWTVGMSHLRFNAQGLVVYHQDYWNATDGIFRHIPILGNMINAVIKRL